MKDLLEKLLKSLGFSGRDWVALLLALLLAFSIWLIHNLSLKYNDYLTISVTAQTNIEGHSDLSSNRCEIVARCRATGYNVIRMKKSAEESHVVMFHPELMKHKSDDVFYITSTDLMEYSHLIYGPEVSVDYYVSDTLFFTFPSMEFKRVPVHPVYSFSYMPQYMNVGELDVVPDTVTIYAESSRMENIDRVFTNPIKRENLNADIQGVVSLEKIRDVRFSEDEVHYSLDVTRYVEVKDKVPISVVGLPSDKDMLVLPSTVDVSLKCVFPLNHDPFDDVELFVRYDDFLHTISGKCPVRLSQIPEDVISYDFSPFYVECIVSDR